MRIRSRFFVGAGLIAVAVGYLIYAAIQNTSEYYMTVNEVAAHHAGLEGQALRVAGRVNPGAISWDPATLTLKFGISQIPDPDDEGAVKKVAVAAATSFDVTCVGQPKPDMFAANKDVIVEGLLDGADRISATQPAAHGGELDWFVTIRSARAGQAFRGVALAPEGDE